MRYQFGEFELDTQKHELRRCAEVLAIEPLQFRLLAYMVSNPDRLLTHDELLSSVWQVSALSKSAINAAISNTRRLLGDSAATQHCIATVPGAGYRFVAPVSPVTAPALSAPELLGQELDYPDKPSVAVMDFAVTGGGERERNFAQGLSVDINANLTRLPQLFTVARASAALVSAAGVAPRVASRCLGVRYLVYGQLAIQSRRMKLTVTIVCGETGAELWSEQYARAVDDIARVQTEIVNAIVAVVNAVVSTAEIERAFSIPSEDLSAWESYHRGLWHIDRPTQEDVLQALQHFQQAVALDPRLCRAYAGLSIIHSSRVFVCVDDEFDEAMRLAADFAQTAIGLSHRDALAHWAWGKVQYLDGQHAQARAVYEHVAQLSPSYAHAYLANAVVCAHDGGNAEALALLNVGERLSPCDPLQFAQDSMRAIALSQLGDYEQAAHWSMKALAAPNAYFMTFAVAVGCQQLCGDSTQAQQLAGQLMSLQPGFTVSAYQRSFPCADEQSRAPFIAALHTVGLPA